MHSLLRRSLHLQYWYAIAKLQHHVSPQCGPGMSGYDVETDTAVASEASHIPIYGHHDNINMHVLTRQYLQT